MSRVQLEDLDTGEGYDNYEAWLASRPASVQALASEFPIGTRFRDADETVWLIGYTETNELILSGVNPYLDWNAAVADRFYCEVDDVRAAFSQGCSHVRSH